MVLSKLYYYIDLYEVIIRNDNGEEYEETYTENLPHHDIIAKEICDNWNEMHMEKYFDGIIEGKIRSAKMTCCRRKDTGETVAKITIEGIPGYRFGSRRRAEVFDQLDAQMSDGWGEGFFDSLIMTAPDGVDFYVI